ncbi:hypothetical protein JOM56_007505 [Amanita muscaria]
MPPVVAPLPAQVATHGYAQIPPNAPQHPIPAPPSVAPKQRPNPEPRPGGESELVVEDIEDLLTYLLLVFSFQVDVSDGEARQEFVAETDMTWEVFHAKVLRYLESAAGKVELTCKVSGDTGKAGQMKGEEDYKSALERVRQRAQNARTRAVSLEIKNIRDAPKPNSKKRTRKDDVPPSVDHVDSETSTQFKSFEQLEAATRCELHHGHCFVSRTGGFDNHRRLDHSEMTLWAKKIERPGKGFHLLLEDLLDAGLLTSADILILEESALTVIGGMGWPHAWALRNFSKHLTLPLLGMRGLQWLEPEFGTS